MPIGKQSLQELFAPTSEATWWERVEKDLKGKALESLNWTPQPNVELRPFYTQAQALPLHEVQQLDWHVCENIQVTDATLANQEALKALRGGANALRFELPKADIDWQKLFKDIHFGYIHSQFAGDLTEEMVLQALDVIEAAMKATDADLKELHLTVQLPKAPSTELLQRAIEAPYSLRVLGVAVPTDLSYSAQISHALVQFEELIRNLEGAYSFNELAQQLHLYWGVGQSYFPELAKLRAFQHLYLHWLEAHGLDAPILIPIHSYTLLENREENPYWDMIAATTQAMSAIIGGCSYLSITPAPLPKKQEYFAKRVARNLQHLLKHESHLHRVVDPSAGSYYVETLSQQLARAAWETFSHAVA